MPAKIRPNRLEVTDRFPMLGFTIRTDGAPQRAEVAIAANPALFRPEHKGERTPSNFHSSRAEGPLAVPRGEAVYIVPPEVLARFVGQERLYFAVATSAEGNGAPQAAAMPDEGSPYVLLRGLTGRSLRRVRIVPSRRAAYGTDGKVTLEWAGDAATPGSVPSGSSPDATRATSPSADYDDGFGPMQPSAAAAPAPTVAPANGNGKNGAPAATIPGNGAPVATSSALYPRPKAPVGRGMSRAMDVGSLVITGERTPVTAPSITRLSELQLTLAKGALSGLAGPLSPVLAALPTAAEAAGVSIGIGPAVGAGLGAGVGLGVGIVFGPDGGVGFYGAAEFQVGFIASISATAQVTVVRGGLENFNGWGLAASISGGEGIVGGASALFDLGGNFQGVSFQLGVGAGLTPVDFYVAVQRQVAVQLSLAQAHTRSGQLPLGRPVSRWTPARAASRTLGDAGPDVDVKLRIFIPSPLVDAPIGAYGGDGRGFSFDQGGSRGELSARVHMSAGGGIMGIDVLDRHWGESTEYDANDAFPVPGKPSWWLDKRPEAVPVNRATLPVTDDNLKIYVGSVGTRRNIQAMAENASIFTIEAIGAMPLSAVAPDIDADLAILVRLAGDGVEAKVEGEHDGFPAYELYVNGQRIYSYDPVAAGNDPTALVAPMDVTVSTNWAAVGSMAAAQALATRPRPRSRVLGGESFSLNWDEVEAVPQPTDVSCWAAAASMVVGWRDRVSLSPDSVAEIARRTTATGLDPAQVGSFAADLGLVAEPPQSYTIDGFRQLLEQNGPLWVGASVPGLHAIVVTGFYSDGNSAFVRVTDPWDRAVGTPGAPGGYLDTHATGSRYILGWEAFVREYEAAATDFSSVNLQILHSDGASGRTANYGSAASAGYAQSMRAPRAARRSRPAGRQLGAESFSLNWDEVEGIAQPTDVSCWAAAAAMVVGWKERVSLAPETLAAICNRTTATGLDPAQVGSFATEIGLVAEPPQSYSLEGFRQILEQDGPLWVGASVPGLHAIVVTGLYSDGNGSMVRITDPWDRQVGTPGAPGGYLDTHATGSRYILKWEDFVREYEAAATDFSSVNLQILHSGSASGRTPNYGSAASAGYAQSLRAPRAARASRPASRPLGADAFSINWDEVEAIAQPTDKSCWAAAAAMVVGWRDRVSLSPESIGEICNRTTASGLDAAQIGQFASEIGLVAEPPQSYSIEGFRRLLENHGPLWVAAAVPTLHAIVVTGLYGEGDTACVRVTDPWDRQVGTPGAPGQYLTTHNTGSRYILRWEDFVREYEAAATDFSSVNLQILHADTALGRTANYGPATSAGYAQAVRPARGSATRRVYARAYADDASAGAVVPAPVPGVRREVGAVGAVRWALDQYDGLRWPASSAPLDPTGAAERVVRLDDWPLVHLAEGDVQLPLTVSWRHLGGGVGGVAIRASEPRILPGWSLTTTAEVTEGADTGPTASLGVSIRHVFGRTGQADVVALTRLVLFGDGTYQRQDQWEQAAAGAA